MRLFFIFFILFYLNTAYASHQDCKAEAFEYLKNHSNSFSGNINVYDYVMTDRVGNTIIQLEKINPINSACTFPEYKSDQVAQMRPITIKNGRWGNHYFTLNLIKESDTYKIIMHLYNVISNKTYKIELSSYKTMSENNKILIHSNINKEQIIFLSEHTFINPEWALNASHQNKVSFQVIKGISTIDCKKIRFTSNYICSDKRMNSFAVTKFLEQVITNSWRVHLEDNNTSHNYENSIISVSYVDTNFHYDVIDTVFQYYESNEQKNILLSGKYELIIQGSELMDNTYAFDHYIFDFNENTREAQVNNFNYKGSYSCDGIYDMFERGNLVALVFNPSKNKEICTLGNTPLFLFMQDNSNQLKVKSDFIYGNGNWFLFNNKKATHSINDSNYYNIPAFYNK